MTLRRALGGLGAIVLGSGVITLMHRSTDPIGDMIAFMTGYFVAVIWEKP